MDNRLIALINKYNEGMNNFDGSISKVMSTVDIYPSVISDYLMCRLEEKFLPGIAKQFLPDALELSDDDGAGAFFDDEKEIAERVFQKYPNRCIIYTTSHCFANCRYCSRKEEWRGKFSCSKFEFDSAIENIRVLPEIEEVLLTGGDLFANSVEDIDYMIRSVTNIPHVKSIRLATRAFTTNPAVVTEELCEMLLKYQNFVVCTQFNHADEFSKETIEALRKIQKTGTPVLNQAVLLKNINDTVPILRELFVKCAINRVIPYYLFHCFKVKGTQCFRTEPLLGYKLISSLVGQIGGWMIPRYTLIPHTTGVKIPVCTNGIVENDGRILTLQDFMGRQVAYE